MAEEEYSLKRGRNLASGRWAWGAWSKTARIYHFPVHGGRACAKLLTKRLNEANWKRKEGQK